MVVSRKLPNFGTWASLAAHAAVLCFIAFAARQTWKVQYPQERGGNHSVLYWQTASVYSAPAHARILPNKTSKLATIKLRKAKFHPDSAQPTPLTSTAGSGTSTQDITPAFPIFFPTPHLSDRSLLPSENRNVVVDVKVTAKGEVSDEQLVHGLGNALDQIILDTVKTWKFHPAMTDGNAVPSVAELVFPLSPSWRG